MQEQEIENTEKIQGQLDQEKALLKDLQEVVEKLGEKFPFYNQ